MRKHGMPAAQDMHPNVTPLIDIVMCLIIFYMLVAKIGVNAGEEKEIVLPESLVGINLTDLGNTVTLNILKGGEVTTLNPRSGEMEIIPPDQGGVRPLTKFLTQCRNQNTEFKVIIRADEVLPYRFLSPVLSCAAEAKVKNVNFATRKKADVVTTKE